MLSDCLPHSGLTGPGLLRDVRVWRTVESKTAPRSPSVPEGPRQSTDMRRQARPQTHVLAGRHGTPIGAEGWRWGGWYQPCACCQPETGSRRCVGGCPTTRGVPAEQPSRAGETECRVIGGTAIRSTSQGAGAIQEIPRGDLTWSGWDLLLGDADKPHVQVMMKEGRHDGDGKAACQVPIRRSPGAGAWFIGLLALALMAQTATAVLHQIVPQLTERSAPLSLRHGANGDIIRGEAASARSGQAAAWRIGLPTE